MVNTSDFRYSSYTVDRNGKKVEFIFTSESFNCFILNSKGELMSGSKQFFYLSKLEQEAVVALASKDKHYLKDVQKAAALLKTFNFEEADEHHGSSR